MRTEKLVSTRPVADPHDNDGVTVATIPPIAIAKNWETYKPMINRAIGFDVDGSLSIERIYKDLQSGAMHLTVVNSAAGLRAVVVTETAEKREGKTLVVALLAGTDSKSWLSTLDNHLAKMGALMECVAIMSSSRPGMSHKMVQLGYEVVMHTMRRAIT